MLKLNKNFLFKIIKIYLFPIPFVIVIQTTKEQTY